MALSLRNLSKPFLSIPLVYPLVNMSWFVTFYLGPYVLADCKRPMYVEETVACTDSFRWSVCSLMVGFIFERNVEAQFEQVTKNAFLAISSQETFWALSQDHSPGWSISQGITSASSSWDCMKGKVNMPFLIGTSEMAGGQVGSMQTCLKEGHIW